MFGETELEACQRLRILEVNEPEKSEGRGNDFQDAMDDVEKGLDIQAAQGSSKGNLIFTPSHFIIFLKGHTGCLILNFAK